MRIRWSSLACVVLSLAGCGEPPAKQPVKATRRAATPPDYTRFAALLRRLRRASFGDTLLLPPLLYRDSAFAEKGQRRQVQYELRLAAKPLGLQPRVIKLHGHGYPVSYSVLVEGRLVALFSNGRFGCYRLPDLTPDVPLEQQLNTKKWARCWQLGGQLVAQHGQGYFAYSVPAHAWQPYTAPMPFGKQPKLYEDARYLVYATCQGEFGGTAYFYNKATGQAHQVGATCANSVWQENGQYYLLASLGHMMGGADAVTIRNPEPLPLARTAKQALTTTAAEAKNVVPLFDFYGLQLFGALRYQRQTLYLMHWRGATFLVTIDGPQITIVDPLFDDGLYTFDPVTTTYGPNLALTNLNDNDQPETSEVAALLWQGRQLTKIEWGRQKKW